MPTVHPIHARVGEVVDIHWHRTDPRDPAADLKARVLVLIERHTAPPLATWDARTTGDVDAGSPSFEGGRLTLRAKGI